MPQDKEKVLPVPLNEERAAKLTRMQAERQLKSGRRVRKVDVIYDFIDNAKK